MLRSLDHLLGYRIACSNGDIGTVEDFFLVDDEWTVRYFIVAAGGWLDRKHVLLSPEVVQGVDDTKREIEVSLTREVVYNSPEMDSDKPVTRQKEILLAEHYGWKPYWTPDPFLTVGLPSDRLEIDALLPGGNPHLRSFREIQTYAVQGGTVTGFATDFIVDDLRWQITGIVISKERTRGEPTVLILPNWVRQIDWTNRVIRVESNGSTENELPAFDFSAAVNARVFLHHLDYHGRLHHSSTVPPDQKEVRGMKRLLDNILGYRVLTPDGEIGRIYDFLFDDSLWILRYLVIETGNLLNRRRVLIAPNATTGIHDARGQIAVNLSHAQVQSSPDIDTDKPVSRQQEILMNAHYGWPAYWSPESLLVIGPAVPSLEPVQLHSEGDPHLRSFREVSTYDLKHGEEIVAKVRDFVVDVPDWSLSGVVVSEGGWLNSRKVELPPNILNGISWANRAFSSNLSTEDLRKLPAFNPASLVNSEVRLVFFDYYGKPVN